MYNLLSTLKNQWKALDRGDKRHELIDEQNPKLLMKIL